MSKDVEKAPASFRPPGPEARGRLAQRMAHERAARRASLIARLEAKVIEMGEDSIYAEMLADMEVRA